MMRFSFTHFFEPITNQGGQVGVFLRNVATTLDSTVISWTQEVARKINEEILPSLLQCWADAAWSLTIFLWAGSLISAVVVPPGTVGAVFARILLPQVVAMTLMFAIVLGDEGN